MSWAASSRPSQAGYPWPEEISETSLNRFSEDKGPIHLTLVDPLVIEAAADVAWSGESFRLDGATDSSFMIASVHSGACLGNLQFFETRPSCR